MIKIICVGKIKESFYREAIQEYQKRLTKYTKLEIIEVPDSGSKQPRYNQQQERDAIMKHLKPKDYIITLEITGKAYTSEALAMHIDHLTTHYSNLVFIIGGSDGLDEQWKTLRHEAISFSNLTFPHQLFRILLLEQLYRSYKIKNNESYHK